MTDYYQLLGVPRSAVAADIQTAFRSLASRFHPDKPGGDGERMKELNVAYTILMDREQRARYDASLPGAPQSIVLACVSAKHYDEVKAMVANGFCGVESETCIFCDGAREVRVGLGGFWERRSCPFCAVPTGSEGR